MIRTFALIATSAALNVSPAFAQKPSDPPASPQTTPPAPPGAPESQPASSTADPKWLERMPKDDRAAIDENLNYAPAAFTDDLKWITQEKLTWATLRGKVVVLQSWTTATSAARGLPMRLANVLKEHEAKDLRIIALHTPEGEESAEDFMKRQKPPERVDVVIDPTGNFCDSLGIYKQPVNLIIDRNGMVRYAGLNFNGVKQAVAQLVAEPFESANVPPVKPTVEETASETGPKFPAQGGSVSGADDIRGKRAPEFQIDSWFTRQPNPQGKVVVVNFWSIDDAASRSAHAHLNQLAEHFGDRIVIVGISEDSRSNFEDELLKHNMSKSDFKYAVALDRSKRMASAINVTQLPHAIVMSKDWTVRWQGRANDLKAPMLQKIVEADAKVNDAAPTSARPKRGWRNTPES